ncbi:Long-chain-fatty-acid--CoA ligase [Acidisarcina polymorpha]|uniref:Long-chain-fatty-acid--CoA ligase n=1 Tax=Acidisarcina polymorpha TaxID=2211140 RepID=A0A2Z5G7B6_9BACT|nr:long-chain fatty acid--CoA ligase [Acidisarcina polymorpha]AXC14860.1 Long-chain-fatty-acid--CoA ligase [Acidisarcina polymorpha]
MPIAAEHPVSHPTSFGLLSANDIFFRLTGDPRENAILYQDGEGFWRPLSTSQIYARVRALAGIFLSWGIKKGDRIAILAENRWEWATTDFAALAIGAVDVPVYPTLTADQTAELLVDSGSRIAVVSTREQYAKVAAIRSRTLLERIIVMDEVPDLVDAIGFSALVTNADNDGKQRFPDFDDRARSIQPDDLATIIYTSGTTGEPKGVMLTHGNIAANVSYSTVGIGFRSDDSSLSFLPLSHITARHLDYALFAQGVTIAYCSSFDKLPVAMISVKPTIFVAVPRVYEKIRQEVERRASLSPIKKRLLRWAIATGHKHRQSILADTLPKSAMWRLAAKLVLTKIHAAFGGRARIFIAGGAPLGVETAGWFADAGIRILEGYGLTETSPVIALNKPRVYRMGSVGKPLPNFECKLASDNELLVRGPAVFRGYWGKPRETAANFTPDGEWFHTGDIARFDEDGFLYITDRKKELIKTSGGKLIAPQPIENKLKANVLVGQAAMVGDRHKFASVLISPNFAALEAWAKERRVGTLERRALIESPAVIAEYQAIIDEVNAGLANFETMKRFKLVPEEWSLEGGELTPSLKMKRRVIAERYAAEIAKFYSDESAFHG